MHVQDSFSEQRFYLNNSKVGWRAPWNCQFSYFFNGNLTFFKWKMGPFEKIVDHIRGVLHFGGRFGGPGLGPGPHH